MKNFARYFPIIFIMTYLLLPLRSSATPPPLDLIVENETIGYGENIEYKAAYTITAGPSFEVESGGHLVLQADQHILLKPGFHVYAGGQLEIKIGGVDQEPPTLITSYPSIGETVGTQGAMFFDLIAVVSDNWSGVEKISLFDENLNEITHDISVDGNSLTYRINSLQDKIYNFTLVVTDKSGNTSTDAISFTVEATIPVTTTNISSGIFDKPIKIFFSNTKTPVTIYYSTDGDPPAIGQQNTIALSDLTQGIIISDNVNLQFFSVDSVGNTEEVKSEVYSILNKPERVSGLNAAYNSITKSVDIAWDSMPVGFNEQGYYVYRCLNVFDCLILMDAEMRQYLPPKRLRIPNGTDIVSVANYVDDSVTPGVEYSYAVTVIDRNNIESNLSSIVAVEISDNTYASSKEEAIKRAKNWLASNQTFQGDWLTSSGNSVLATSQVLDALRLSGKYDLPVRKGIFKLRGTYADNNDFLARKINTLYGYNQNVENFLVKLIANSNMIGLSIDGFGIKKKYQADPLTSSLGVRALELTRKDFFTIWGKDVLRNNIYNAIIKYDSTYPSFNMRSAENDKFGWAVNGEPSIYVSSLVYNTLRNKFPNESPYFSELWITNSQNADGSFGNGLYDTAAVLLWIELDTTSAELAEQYIVNQQNQAGYWGNGPGDPYLTGLCLSTLLRDQYVEDIIPEKNIDTLYVDINGNDANDCRVQSTGACRSIGAAILKGKDNCVIYIAPGTYDEKLTTIDKRIWIVGTSDINKPIIRPESNTGGNKYNDGWYKIVNNGKLSIENLIFDGAGKQIVDGFNFLPDSKGGLINNCEVRNIKYVDLLGYGVYIQGDSVLVLNSTFSQIEKTAVFSSNSGKINYIRNCVFNGKGDGSYIDYGVFLWAGSDGYIDNNVFNDFRSAYCQGSLCYYAVPVVITENCLKTRLVNNSFNNCTGYPSVEDYANIVYPLNQ